MLESIAYVFLIIVAGLNVIPAAHAGGDGEGYCGTKAPYTNVSAFMKQARTDEKAGRYRDAYASIQRIDKTECPSNYDVDEFHAIKKRLNLKFGEQAEKEAHFYPEAAKYFHAAESFADEDRVMMKYARSAPTNIKVFATAFGYFDRDRHDGHSESDIRKLKAIASAAAAAELKKEDAAFARVSASHANSITAISESRKHLEIARDWLRFVPEQMKDVSARAVQRGDKFAAEDGRESLRTALDYYGFAENPGKEKSVRNKARRLGDEHAKKGETLVAVDFYRIAGDTDKADALDKRSKQERAKVEQKRQKNFKKESDDLEKELGF